MKIEALVVLDWLVAHTPQIVQLLTALVPVLALFVVAYALNVIVRLHTSGKKK